MAGEVLDSFYIYTLYKQISDIGVSKNMGRHLEVNRIHNIWIMPRVLTFDGLKCYFSFRSIILTILDGRGFPMSIASYHNYLNAAIHALDRILWGYTARDCIEIIKQFLPE